MSRGDRLLGAVLIAHGLLGVTWIYWVASQIGFPTLFVATNAALAALGMAAGISWLLRRRAAAYLAIGFYVVQLLHIIAPSFRWSFTLGFNINIGLGWFGSGEVAVNLFALAMLGWCGARMFSPGAASGATSPPDQD